MNTDSRKCIYYPSKYQQWYINNRLYAVYPITIINICMSKNGILCIVFLNAFKRNCQVTNITKLLQFITRMAISHLYTSALSLALISLISTAAELVPSGVLIPTFETYTAVVASAPQ